ncbi:condensation domain-containing protein, partial [Janthinobacterium sp. GB4P2]|uniref:condensation domain-containing protein n=1 Tax=Janthinobacterium sp. GB4P2 TaxID=3424189 RepID=UPI003F21D50A
EAKLAACAGVREAIVIARENAGDKRLVAYLTAHEGMAPSTAELRSELARGLAEYMVPSAFVLLPAFPLTPNGKLDRNALPAPDQDALAVQQYEAPVGEVETALAGIWQELLGLAQVGRHDQFFELGGHSFTVITLIERLRQQNLIATVRTVFATPTLAAMAAVIVDARVTSVQQYIAAPNLIPDGTLTITPEMLSLIQLTQPEIDCIVASVPGGAANIQDIYPLSPLQEGMLFHHLMETQGDAYLLRSLLIFDSRTRLDNFVEALAFVMNRHDILRTAISWQGLSQPLQIVYRDAPLTLKEYDLSSDVDAQQQMLEQTDPRHYRIDLHRAPLIEAHVGRDAHTGEWIMSLLTHHIVEDNYSLQRIMAEIQLVLNGKRTTIGPSWPYRNFIAQSLSMPTEAHESYFREQLGDIDEPTAAFGQLDVNGSGSDVAEAEYELRDGMAKKIRDVARIEGVTPSVLFHVALARVLGECSGREEVVFGSVLSGRLQGTAGADQVSGPLINTLPIRVSLTKRNVSEVVVETYQKLTDLLAHEQAPLLLAQRCSGVKVPLPLFNTLFNYRNTTAGIGNSNTEAPEPAWVGIRLLTSEERTNYPITICVDDLGEGFVLTAQTVHGIDPSRIVAYLRTAIEALVQALTTSPHKKISRLNILPTSERKQVLFDFNPVPMVAPAILVHQRFETHAARTPEAIALTYGEQQL